MTVAYATTAELGDWLDDDESPLLDDRLLQRASELLDATVRFPFAVDDDTDLPTDADVAAAMRDACCAQVEYWGEVDESHDIEGLAGVGVGIGHLRLDALPPDVAPRARRILHTAGLLTQVSLGELVGWST